MPGSSSNTASGAYGNVNIGGTAAVIRAARSGRGSILIKNNHATQILYVGKDDQVTTSNGFPVAADGGTVLLEGYLGDVYGIASGADTDVRWIEVG